MKNSIFNYLRDSSGTIWGDYLRHPFVQSIGNGSLSGKSFKYYLVQDYLFLTQFGRAYALAAYKSDTLEDMRSAAAAMINIIDFELQLHIDYCSSWGLTLDDLSGQHEDLATTAYTRFVIDCGNRGDLLDLMTALAPCVVGYAEIGRKLSESPTIDLERNPFKSWIDMYSGETYQKISEAATQQLQALFKRRGGPDRYNSLSAIFNQATRLEIEFWEMAWKQRN
jgi:thiaminase/transcriptional activator TenA